MKGTVKCLVAQGRYAEVIRYRAHVLPLVHDLRCMLGLDPVRPVVLHQCTTT